MLFHLPVVLSKESPPVYGGLRGARCTSSNINLCNRMAVSQKTKAGIDFGQVGPVRLIDHPTSMFII